MPLTSDHKYWIKNQIPAIGRNFYLGTVVVRVNGNETNDDGDVAVDDNE